MRFDRRVRTPLATLLIVLYGAIVTGGSALHDLSACSHQTFSLGKGGSSGHWRPSHACPLCQFLAKGQMPAPRVSVEGAAGCQSGDVVERTSVPVASVKRSMRARAPPVSEDLVPKCAGMFM